ncbi:MAG: FkbM family methyltransferase [Ardenticatenaceae bacterium]|nr:FkbM family methyltransferase [Ardenticatenaceae bacterium]
MLWSFRKLGRNKFARQATKKAFGLIYRDGKIITIKRGPLAGLKWVCHSHHQFWMPLGMYEVETANWLKNQMDTSSVFFDIGANAGYFTLLGCRQIKAGQIISFEPVPLNAKTIKKQLEINNFENGVVEQIALSDKNETSLFSVANNNANSHLVEVDTPHTNGREKAQISVKTLTLDEYVNTRNIKPDLVKIDVEGAEAKVLCGANETISHFRPNCLVSTHSQNLYEECRDFFIKHNYRVSPLPGFDHELICFSS